MTNLPQKVEIDAATAKRLTDLNDKQAALQQIIAMAQQNWERRGAEIQAEGRAIWDDIAKRYNLDVEHVNYTIGPDGNSLVPVAMRLT